MAFYSNLSIGGLALTILLFTTATASADDMGGESIDVPPPAGSATAPMTPSDPPTDDLCMKAKTYDPDRPWRYDTEFLFPATRHMHCSELPMAAQVVMYPFAVVVDVFQLPVGALAGLGGE